MDFRVQVGHRTAYADSLVLKGGVLLAAYDARRPTRDIDMHARALDNNADQILQHVRAIAAAGSDDGLIFDADEATATVIRDESNNTGVLVSLTANLAAARLSCMWT